MDDKVLKLLDRAIAEKLSYSDVSSIMSFNGYDQVAIEEALSELKKKRPEFVSDVQFPSEGVDSTAYNAPTPEAQPAEESASDVIPDDLTKADYVNNREPLLNFADQQAQLAQDLNDKYRDADPDPLNFFEKAYARTKGFVKGSMFPAIGTTLAEMEVVGERTRQQEEFDQDIDAQNALRDKRIEANALINEKLGFEYNLYEEDEQGVLRANKEKKKQFEELLEAYNGQAEYIRNSVAIEDAIEFQQKADMPGWYESVSSPVLSAITFGESTAINLFGTLADAVGAPERIAGRASMGPARTRAEAQIRAGLDPKDDRSFTEYIEDGEIGKGAKSLGLTLAENLPQIITTIYNPSIGLKIGGVSAGTASYMDVRNRLDMTAAEKVSTMAVSGAAEYLFERISLTDIKLARKALGIDEAVELAGDTAKKEARAKAMSALRKEARLKPIRQVGEQFLSEGLEEVGVELTNSMLSFMISGELTDPRDVLESFLIGGIMGGGTVAVPTALAKGLNGLATRANMKEFKRVTDEIASLREQLNSNMSEYDRSKIQDKIVQLGMVQQSIAAASMDVYKGMPSEAQKQMLGIHKDLNAALNTYNKLTDDKAKKQQLGIIRDLIRDKNILEQEYGGQAIDAIKNNPQNIKVGEKYNKSFDESRTFNDGVVKEGNGITKSEAKMMSRIFGIVKGDSSAKVVVHNSLRSLVNSNDAARKIFRDSKGRTRSAAYVTTAKNGSKTIHVLSPHAYRQYKQYTGRDSGAAKTYAHEVIHTALDQMLVTDPIAQERLYEELNQEAAKGNVFAKEALKFAEKYTDDKGFDENTRKNEALTEFLALMTRGNNLESMKRDNPGLLQKIRNIFNDLLASVGYTDIRIEDDADLFTVAKNLSTAMRTGSTVKFGRDIAAEARQEATQQPETQPEVAPAMSAEDSDLDDIAFTLFEAKYKDQDKINELTGLFVDDSSFLKAVEDDLNTIEMIPTSKGSVDISSDGFTTSNNQTIREAFEETLKESIFDTDIEFITEDNQQEIIDIAVNFNRGIETVLMDTSLLKLAEENDTVAMALDRMVFDVLGKFGIDYIRSWLEGDYSLNNTVEGARSRLVAFAQVYRDTDELVNYSSYESYIDDVYTNATPEDFEDGLIKPLQDRVNDFIKTVERETTPKREIDLLDVQEVSLETWDNTLVSSVEELQDIAAEAQDDLDENFEELDYQSEGHFHMSVKIQETLEHIKTILTDDGVRSYFDRFPFQKYGLIESLFDGITDYVDQLSGSENLLDQFDIDDSLESHRYVLAKWDALIDFYKSNPTATIFSSTDISAQENFIYEIIATHDTFNDAYDNFVTDIVTHSHAIINAVKSDRPDLMLGSRTNSANAVTQMIESPQTQVVTTPAQGVGGEFTNFLDLFNDMFVNNRDEYTLGQGNLANTVLFKYYEEEVEEFVEDENVPGMTLGWHGGSTESIEDLTVELIMVDGLPQVEISGYVKDGNNYGAFVQHRYTLELFIDMFMSPMRQDVNSDIYKYSFGNTSNSFNINQFVDMKTNNNGVAVYTPEENRFEAPKQLQSNVSVEELKQEVKGLASDIINITTDSENRGSLFNVVDVLYDYLKGEALGPTGISSVAHSMISAEVDASKYKNLIDAYKANPSRIIGGTYGASSKIKNVIYAAIAEANLANELPHKYDTVLAPKMYDLSANIDEVKYVSLVGQTTDVFTSEFKAESPLIQALDPSVLKMKKATPDQWMSLFSKSAPTSQEAEFIGLRQWLNDTYIAKNRQSITAEEVTGYVAQNIVLPFVTSPFGSYMWTKSELIAPGKLKVPILADENTAITVASTEAEAVRMGTDMWNTEFHQFLDDVMSDSRSNPETFGYEAGNYFDRDFQEAIAKAYIDFLRGDENNEVLNSVTYHDGIQVKWKPIEEGEEAWNLFIDGSLAYEDTDESLMERGDDISIDPEDEIGINARWVYLVEKALGSLDYMDGQYSITDGVLNIFGNEIKLTPTIPEVDEVISEDNELSIVEYKTLNIPEEISNINEAVSYARTTFGTGGRMVLGKHGSYSLQSKGNPGPIISYSEVLVRVPRRITDMQKVDPFKQPGHYSNENIVVHMRMGEAATPNGERVLFLDEIQSDWGQKARRRGQMPNPRTLDEANKYATIARNIDNLQLGIASLNHMESRIREVVEKRRSSHESLGLTADEIVHKLTLRTLQPTDITNRIGLKDMPRLSDALGVLNNFSAEIKGDIEPTLEKVNQLAFSLRSIGRKWDSPESDTDLKYLGITGFTQRTQDLKIALEETLRRMQEKVKSVLEENSPYLVEEFMDASNRSIDNDLRAYDATVTNTVTALMQNESYQDLTEEEKSLIESLSVGQGLEANLKLAMSSTNVNNSLAPYSPWNTNNRWVNLAIRTAMKLAVQGGFDYVSWTPGDIQSTRWSGQDGVAAFYDKTVPSISKKEIKRFDKKATPRVIQLRNRMNDITSGSFDALGIPVTDKIIDKFNQGGLTSFSLDTDMTPRVPEVITENPINITNALQFADAATDINNKIEFKEGLNDMIRDKKVWNRIVKEYNLKLKKGTDGLDHIVMDDNAKNYVADMFEYETLIALKAYPDALGWYNETVGKSLAVMSMIHPEFKSDKTAADAFKMAVAITSNGNKVTDNFKEANRQYEYFKKNGRFDNQRSIGTQSNAIKSSLSFINQLLEVMSMENLVEFMTTKVTAGELKYKTDGGQDVTFSTGYLVDQQIYGANILGPKIGNGFFMNLYGVFSELTMDRWFVRQTGRFMGSLLSKRNAKATKSQQKRFISNIKKLNVKERKILASITKHPILSDPYFKLTGRDTGIDFLELAKHVSKLSMDKGNREIALNEKVSKTLNEVRLGANGWVNNLQGEKEVPANGTERAFMIDVANMVQRALFVKYGISIDIADFQAVNWYPEKALYQTFQAKSSISSAKEYTSSEEKPDYFSAATVLAKESGIKQEDIDKVINNLDNKRNESVREDVRKRTQELGSDDQKANVEQVGKAIAQVRAGEEVEKTFFHLDTEYSGYTQGSRLGDIEYSSVQPHVKQAKTYLERVMNDKPFLELDGPDVIRDAADVAFLLRHMESESSESTYVVVRDMDNPSNYEVTYMTTGTVNSALVDNIKVRQIVTKFQEVNGADTNVGITMVHNHPSGNLDKSTNDMLMHRKLLEVFKNDTSVTVEESVIINLDSGEYSTFTDQGFGSRARVPYDTKTKKVEVQNFNRQELYRPRGIQDAQIRSSHSVAQMISHFKMSPTTKLGVIISNQRLAITRIAVLDSGASPKELALMLERTVGKYGNRMLFFGNDKAALKALAVEAKKGLEAQNIDLLDAVYIKENDRNESASDQGYVPGSSAFNTMFSLEESRMSAPEGSMSIERSTRMLEFDAKMSPLYRERKLELSSEEDIEKVLRSHKSGLEVLKRNAVLKNGDLVGGRLNINLVKHGTNTLGYRPSILSVHKPKSKNTKKHEKHNGVSSFSNEPVVRNQDIMTLRNAYFNVNQKGSANVGLKGFMFMNGRAAELDNYPTALNKFPLASVDGEYVDMPREDMTLDGIMIKYNPTSSHMFVDLTGRPIKFAEEVTLMGDRVYARGKIIYSEQPWEQFQVPGVDGSSFTVPSIVTTDSQQIVDSYNSLRENGIQFSIDEEGYESHNNIDEKSINMRRTAKRFADSLGDAEADIRKKIIENPENYIGKQDLSGIKEDLLEMSDEELVAIMTDSALVNLSLDSEFYNNNIFVLAAIERINRMQRKGEDTSDAIEQLAKVGTTVGRMLRQFAELKSSSPIGIVTIVESAMSKAGRRMTDGQRQRLMALANTYMEAQRRLIDLHAQSSTMDSKTFTEEFTRLSKALDVETRKLNKMTGVLIPKGYANLFGTFIKGNLMTTVSLITNVTANVFEQVRFAIQRPIEGLVHFASFKASKLASKFLGRDVGVQEYYGREFGVTLLALPYALKRGGIGLYEAVRNLFVRSSESNKIIHTGLQPMYALYAMASDTKLADFLNKTMGREIIKSDILPRDKNGKIKGGDRLKLFVEGVFGIAPDIVFRALPLGDKPFSNFSAAFVVYNEAVKKFGVANMDSDEAQNFLKYPPQEVVAKMDREGERATFQERNKAADAILQFRKIIEGKGRIPGKMMGLIFDSFMPYVKTPANIFVSTMKIAMPGLGAISAMYNYSQGNHKKANEDLSMALVGTMMIKTADLLIAAGAIIGAFTDEDKEEKSLEYLMHGPMTINTSAIRRYLRTMNPEALKEQEGDMWRKLDKMGIIGVVMGARATATKGVKFDETSKQNTWYSPGEEPLFDTSFLFNYLNPEMMSGTFKFINSMSFLQGANSLLSLIAGDAEGYDMQRNVDNWFRSVTSIVLPNQISAVNRANRPFMPIFRNKDVSRRMIYILRDKTVNTDMYPPRIDLVGREIKQTPEGKNPLYYHLVSVFKGREVDTHPVINEYYRLMNAVEDGSWLPSAPSRLTNYFYTVSKTDVGASRYAKITELAGQGNKPKIRFTEEELVSMQKTFFTDLTNNVQQLMKQDVYKNASDEEKVEKIKEIIAWTRKPTFTLSRDKFGTVKGTANWYNEFQEALPKKVDGLEKQMKDEARGN